MVGFCIPIGPDFKYVQYKYKNNKLLKESGMAVPKSIRIHVNKLGDCMYINLMNYKGHPYFSPLSRLSR